MGVLDLGGVPDYQSLDKWLDQVYMATFLIVACAGPVRRDRSPSRSISSGWSARSLFELTGDRTLLLFFPNVFEFWFIFVAALGAERVGRWPTQRLAVALVAPDAAEGDPGVGAPRRPAVRLASARSRRSISFGGA